MQDSHDRKGRAVVKLPHARKREQVEDTLYSIVHNVVSRDVTSKVHIHKSKSFICDGDVTFKIHTHKSQSCWM